MPPSYSLGSTATVDDIAIQFGLNVVAKPEWDGSLVQTSWTDKEGMVRF